MKLLTAKQMRALDRVATLRYGVPSLALMERAGQGVADCVRRYLTPPGPVAVVLGKGNNAGDGLVAARHLREAGYRMQLFLAAPVAEFAPDAAANWERLQPQSHEIHHIQTNDQLAAATADIQRAAYIIDALLGTGCDTPVEGHWRAVIDWINCAGRPVLAVDIPSGLSADTGHPMGAAVRARVTVTLGHPKLGLVLDPGYDYAGAVEVVDIGIPSAADVQIDSPYRLLAVADFAVTWPKRKASSHKGTFGHLLVIAGSLGKMGAGLLASRAALRTGAGLVTYALPTAAFEKFDPAAQEVMLLPLPDDGIGRLAPSAVPTLVATMKDTSVVAVGPGLGVHPETTKVLTTLIEHVPFPLVIDADALNGLAALTKHEARSTKHESILNRRKAPTIITPHPGEMARLIGKTTHDVQADRARIAQAFATEHNVICVLKGHRTVIALPNGLVYVNPTGNPGMATAGTGDVLTGVIGGLLAQRMPLEAAACAGVYLHGLAGDIAAQHKGTMGLIASDVIESLPEAIRLIESSCQ